MCTRRIETRIVAGLLAAFTVQGETLYRRDGIALEGTVRMVTRGAAVCHVVEDRHPAEEYERTKANDGQPVHVWRMDFVARNGSGRRLEQLTAHFTIPSKWPPCTKLRGPEGRDAQPLQWKGSFEVVQKPAGIEPGEEVGVARDEPSG